MTFKVPYTVCDTIHFSLPFFPFSFTPIFSFSPLVFFFIFLPFFPFILPVSTEGPKENAVMHFSFEYSLLFQDYA